MHRFVALFLLSPARYLVPHLCRSLLCIQAELRGIYSNLCNDDTPMVRKAAYDEAGGFDPGFIAAYHDLDFCLRLRARNYLVVWTPQAELCDAASRRWALPAGGNAPEPQRGRAPGA